MKRLPIILGLLLAACAQEIPVQEPDSRAPRGPVSHGMIELGEKMENPYTVDNMQKALMSVYPTKADRVDIHPTDRYVRFLPRTDAELDRLRALGLYLMDHPMDYRIVTEGDYYCDPSLDKESITWQYAVVENGFIAPDGILMEEIDRCYISEHAPDTRASDGIDWSLVEAESFRLTGNADLLSPATKAASEFPSGRITMSDPGYCGGQPVGVSGVTIACNVFVKIGVCHTDRDGYYSMPLSFSSDPRYRIVFQNDKGFSIGLNLVMIPASVSTLGTGGPGGIDYNITQEDDNALMRRTAVNNAAYDYITRCTPQDLDISAPPSDIRIWIFPFVKPSSAPMLHHGAGLDHELVEQYAGKYVTPFKIFMPDITIGTSGAETFADIYSSTVHEFAHASHFAKVGKQYWTPYISYIVRSYLLENRESYGHGTGEGAGHCAVGEMWAYFMGSTLNKDRYGGSLPSYPAWMWFRPEIFSCMYERGTSRSEIFRALSADVTSVEELKKQLIHLYPEREELIEESFERYGK